MPRATPTPSARATSVACCLIALVAMVALGGCKSRAALENDRLRRENLELKDQVAGLTREREELRVKLASEAATRDAVPELSQEALDALPRCTSLEISMLSGFTPLDRAAAATGVTAYLSPADGRGRFVQVVGSIEVEAYALPSGPAQDAAGSTLPDPQAPALLGSKRLTPAQVRDAYRSGFTGTHYAIDLALVNSIKPGTPRPTLLIRARLLDALSGQTFTAERIVRAQPEPTRPREAAAAK